MKKILFIAALCLMSTLTFAAKPDWAGKGKPDREDVEAMAEQMQDSERRSEMLDRGKPEKGKKDKKHKDDDDYDDYHDEEYEDDHDDDYDDDEEFECELSKEECAAIRAERKAERMAEKEARKAEREAEKEARKAEHEAEKAAREAEREAARAERDATRGERGNSAAGAENRNNAGQQQAGGKDAAMEKQAEMKAEMEQKELDKGSDKGQEMRETKSKKWWQFWK